MLHISLAAEQLWTLWGFPISNALLTTWVVMAVLIVFAWLASRKLSIIPGTIQVIAELIVGGLYDFFQGIAGSYVGQFFPLVASLFIYILLANWIGLLPGVGTIGFYRSTASAAAPEFIPLFRGAMSDLNTTIALALTSVIAMQYFGFKNLGHHYGQRFVNFKDPIMFSVGLLEVISDLSKVISFAFRLFGNIFAGEVLLAVMAFLMPFIVPLPFLFMELFVGLIQALVFSMLSTAFFAVAVTHEG
jgi:F-type H+-transporting ATPase subunit a